MDTRSKTPPVFQLGDKVGVRYWPKWRGRIIELRGPLGPGGMHIYRVRFRNFHKPKNIELMEDQLILLTDEEKASK